MLFKPTVNNYAAQKVFYLFLSKDHQETPDGEWQVYDVTWTKYCLDSS